MKPELEDLRCDDCAFREGTKANLQQTTVMKAQLCAEIPEEFHCHRREGLCAGWAALANNLNREGYHAAQPGILEAPMKAAEAAIQSGEEPGSKADHAVRARWERLGLDPSTAPTVFASDVENMVEEELRGLRDGAGRAVVQYSDPAL